VVAGTALDRVAAAVPVDDVVALAAALVIVAARPVDGVVAARTGLVLAIPAVRLPLEVVGVGPVRLGHAGGLAAVLAVGQDCGGADAERQDGEQPEDHERSLHSLSSFGGVEGRRVHPSRLKT